jgi:hypothetical protein
MHCAASFLVASRTIRQIKAGGEYRAGAKSSRGVPALGLRAGAASPFIPTDNPKSIPRLLPRDEHE